MSLSIDEPHHRPINTAETHITVLNENDGDRSAPTITDTPNEPTTVVNESEPLLPPKTSEDTPPKYHSSFLTIFSVWNTMMGSALLSLPWGFSISGIAGGLIVVAAMGLTCWYTAMLVMRNGKGSSDFIDACSEYLGWPGKYLAWAGSVLVLIGACIIYFILMSTNLNTLVVGVVTLITGDWTDTEWWGKYTVPLYVLLLLLPFLNLKNWSVFVKINSIGIVSPFIWAINNFS